MKKLVTCLSLLLISASSIAAPKTGMPQMPPSFVDVAKAQTIDYQLQIQSTGTLNAVQGVTMHPEASGKITAIYFKSGQTVKQGTPLIEIDPVIPQARLVQAQAQLKLDAVNYRRAQELIKEHAISTQDFDKAAASYHGSQGKVDEAKGALNQCKVITPFSGKLGLRLVSMGQYVNSDVGIVNLQILDPLQVDFSIPEVYLSDVAVGQAVLLHSDAYPNKKFEGKITAVESLIDKNTRSVDVRAQLSNPNKLLLPGMFVQVTLLAGNKEKVLAVPQTAVSYNEQGAFVYKIVNGHAVVTKVTLGPRSDNLVIIKEGLKAGDTVAAAGALKLRDGATVIIRNK